MRYVTSAEREKILVELEKLTAETIKLHSESRKINRENFWYPVAIASGLFGVVGTVIALLIKLMK